MKFTYSRNERLPKLTAACSTETGRPHLQHVRVDTKLKEIQASDSYIAVRVPVELEKGDKAGLVEAKVFKTKANRVTAKPNPAAKLKDFPSLVEVWPAQQAVEDGFRVGLNAQFLKRVIDAVGTEGPNHTIELIFPAYSEPLVPHALRPVIVRAQGQPKRDKVPAGGVAETEGLIMPVRLRANVATIGAPAVTAEAQKDKVQRDEAEIRKGLTKMQKGLKNAKKEAGTKTAPGGAKAKTTIPYAGVADDKLTAGQKAARTKALRKNGNGNDITTAAGRRANSEARQTDRAKMLSNRAVKAAATRAAKKKAAATA